MLAAKDDLSDLWISEHGLGTSVINATQLRSEQFYGIHFSPRAPTPAFISFSMQNPTLFIISSQWQWKEFDVRLLLITPKDLVIALT